MPRTPNETCRVLIGGVSYGMGNVGDEGILQGIVKDIRSVDPVAEITVLTWKPNTTAALLGVRAVRTRVRSVLSEIVRADVLVCGGASIIAEYYDRHGSLPERLKGYPGYPLALATLARLFGKKVMFYAVGVEPIRSHWFRFWAGRSPSLGHVFTVRDKASKQLLGEWGDNSRVEVTADPAFGLSVPPQEVTDAFMVEQGLVIPDKLLSVGMSMAYEPKFVDKLDEQIDFMAGVAQALIDEDDAYIVLIPMNTNPRLDRQGLMRVAYKLPVDRVFVLDGDYTPSQVIGLATRLDLVVSSRMHLLILAAVANTPFAAVSRGPKIDALVERFGTELVAQVSDLNVPRAKAKIEQILQSSTRSSMPQHLDSIRVQLRTNQDRLAALLSSCPKQRSLF